MGLFLNAHSPTVAEQLRPQRLRLTAGRFATRADGLRETFRDVRRDRERRRYKSLVRVGGYDDHPGIQQALDMGRRQMAVLVPYRHKHR